MGIKEFVRQIGEIAHAKLTGREGCVVEVDDEIVFCVKNEPGYLLAGVKFDDDIPWMLRSAGINIINRMVFNLSPGEASAIVTSTMPKVRVFQRRKEQLLCST
ncbi:MAG TPA: hypothetical protein VMT62_08225 [Syntrophorhabdaceae bacterium]|nr:hypothetical protein [Syntrophorhabdaceae bacterium]